MSDQVRASHILIKTQLSRRPASFRDPQGLRILATTQDAAITQMEKIRQDIVDGKVSFGQVAEDISDCSSAQNQGDLGRFGRGMMQQSFENAAFALKVGEISPLVISDSGVHIILRTE